MKKNIFIKVFATVLFLSCTKLVQVDPPKTQLVSENVFDNDATAEAAMAGVYAYLSPNYFNFIDYLTVTGEFAADNASYTAGDANYDAFTSNSLNSSNAYISTLWSVPYQTIYACNAVLEGISESPNLSVSTIKQLSGEASFIRAFSYFYLSNLFGDVPLVLSTDVSKNSLLPGIKRNDVFNQIILDLTNAMENLSTSSPVVPNIRANQFAAAAMLARVYLYAGDWVNAEKMSSQVISSGNYTLETDLNKVFFASSNEAILEYSTQQGFTFLGAYFIPPYLPAVPAIILSQNFISTFDSADLRKQAWMDTTTSNGNYYTYPLKYKQASPNSGSLSENYVALRLAEQYLIRAEARDRQNNISGSVEDINAIRKRAGLLPTTVSNPDSLLKIISQERRKELFYEWSDRWIDLKRTGKVNNVIGTYKPADWQSTDSLYPIPQQQIGANPNLIQNSGY